jgi:hypothetical protein
MLIHLVAAEQFRSQWRLGSGELLGQAVPANACTPTDQEFANGPAAHLQISGLLLGSGSNFKKRE